MENASELLTSDRLTRLSQSNLFEGIDNPATLLNEDDWEARQADTGETVLDPVRHNGHMLILLEGELSVTLEAETLHPVARIRPYECFGELSILDDNPPSAHVVAAQPSCYLAINRDALWRSIDRNPLIARNLLKILAQRVREKNSLLVNSLGLLQYYRTQAEKDALTGLNNRNWLMEIFPEQLSLSLKIGHSVSLLTIDIDHFKSLNDNYGHAAGDRVLRHVADIMKSNVRSTDLLARYGGEEFVILMPGAHISKALRSAERLRRVIANNRYQVEKGVDVGLSVSIGVAECLPGWGLDELLAASDRALYTAKNDGRNRVCLAPNPFRP